MKNFIRKNFIFMKKNLLDTNTMSIENQATVMHHQGKVGHSSHNIHLMMALQMTEECTTNTHHRMAQDITQDQECIMVDHHNTL